MVPAVAYIMKTMNSNKKMNTIDFRPSFNAATMVCRPLAFFNNFDSLKTRASCTVLETAIGRRAPFADHCSIVTTLTERTGGGQLVRNDTTETQLAYS